MEDKDRSALLLADPKAPQGDLHSDLKTALYLAACYGMADLSLKDGYGLLRGFLPQLDYRGLKATDERIEENLEALVSDGALLRVGERYARAADAREATLKVIALEGENYVDDETGRYALVRRPHLTVLRGDEVAVLLLPFEKRALVQKITKARTYITGLFGYVSGSGAEIEAKDFPGLVFPVVGVTAPEEPRSNDLVIGKIVSRRGHTVSVEVSEICSEISSIDEAIRQAMLTYDINPKFPQNVLRAARRVSQEVAETEIQGRVDVRDLPLVTIDGEDARDFDDAVYVSPTKSGYDLYVAIADVSYYVRPGSLIDREAVTRTTSVYFPYYVAPMLPVELSNGICSLNPDVDRLCMVCQLSITRTGQIKAWKFYPAVMRSHGRLTYTEAYTMITEGTTPHAGHESLVEHVKNLHALYLALKKARERRGAIDMEGDEVTFSFDEHLNVDGIIPETRNDAHMMIEECMIAANIAAARFVSDHESDTLYRVHAAPSEQKLETLRTFLATRGITIDIKDEPTSKDMAKLARAVKDRPDAQIIYLMILRSMAKAVYSPDNIGHFGLALPFYAHFTSPIRRYPDLQIHRVIKDLLEKDKPRHWGKIGARSYTKEELVALGERCSERELNAGRAEMDVDNSLKCMCVQRYIGHVVRGMVTATAPFGIFVNLTDFHIDGMIFVGDIAPLTISDFTPGQSIDVLITNVEVNTRKINLLHTTLEKPTRRRKPKESAVTAEIPDFSAHAAPSEALKEALLRKTASVNRQVAALVEGSEDSAAELNARAATLASGDVSRSVESAKRKKKKDVPVQSETAAEKAGAKAVSEDDSSALYPLKAFLEMWTAKKGAAKGPNRPIEVSLKNLSPDEVKTGKQARKKARAKKKRERRKAKARLLKARQAGFAPDTEE